ncbi:MAG: hypothetical protein GF393_09570 [Armatimonadia bacterium]|nr:hypothetical protein [Armatimonadia bacterium]
MASRCAPDRPLLESPVFFGHTVDASCSGGLCRPKGAFTVPRTTSVLLALSAFVCMQLLSPCAPATAQDDRPRDDTLTRNQQDRDDRSMAETDDTAEARAMDEGDLEGEELTPEELDRLRELLRTEEDQPEDPEEVEKPPTAAERFVALERFGMRVFGYEPPGESEEVAEPAEDREERAETAAKPPADSEDQPDEAKSERPRRTTAGVVATEPVPPTYVLGPGDELAVRVWTDAIEHVQARPVVDAEGSIYLELLGEVTVAGERMSRVREMIRQRYRAFFDRAEVSVGLSRTRVIEVRVTGDVRTPGTHVLSGAATLFSALNAAGGPNDVGSFRAIKLVRRGEAPMVVDLYDYLLRGEIDADVPLEPNDTIFVPPLAAEFGVAGEVRRPARYEMTAPVTIAEALQMAAGVGGTGYPQHAQLWRVGEKGVRELINVDARAEGAQMCMQSGDLLVIPPVLEDPINVVTLEGAVERPGDYQVRPDMRVSDLLGMANGITEQAHTESAELWRLGDDLDYDLMHFDPAAAVAGDPEHNLELMARDRVVVLSEEQVEAPMEVTVEGQVRVPDTYDWTRGMTVSDLVRRAGGLVEGAYTPQANLLRLGDDQRRELIPVNLASALTEDDGADVPLHRGDLLRVLAREEHTEKSQVRVTGLVVTQGWYERPEGMRVSNAILAAGGPAMDAGDAIQYTPGGAVGEVEPIYLVLRREGETFKVEPDPIIRDNDLITVLGTGDLIPSAPIATIRGRVKTPGVYAVQHAPGDPDTIYDLIQRAGGLLPNANPGGIVLYRVREEIMAHEQEGDLEQVIAHFNRELAAATVEGEEQRAAGTAATVSQGLQAALSEGAATVVIPPRRLSEEQWARAVPIDGEKLVASEGAEGDFPLTEGDVIVVPETPTTITVMGAVVRPGATPYAENLTPLDYITGDAGGLTPDARKRRTVIVRANGAVTPNALRAEVKPGDVILVPSDYIFRNVNKPGTLERVLDAVTAIIGGYLIFN